MSESTLSPVAIEIQLYALLLIKLFNQALEDRLHDQGVKASSLQHGILRMLQFETLTISEMSQRLGLDPSTLVRAVDSLEHKGLAQRGSDLHDRRRHPISLTEEGIGLVTAVPVISDEDPVYQALHSLGLGSATQLRDLLRELAVQFPEGKLVAGLMSGQTEDQ
jgi:DNA-binding MarR family transcriptional regulator